MTIAAFWCKYHWHLFVEQQTSIGSDDRLAPNRWQAINWNKYGLVYLRIYAPRGLYELNV